MITFLDLLFVSLLVAMEWSKLILSEPIVGLVAAGLSVGVTAVNFVDLLHVRMQAAEFEGHHTTESSFGTGARGLMDQSFELDEDTQAIADKVAAWAAQVQNRNLTLAQADEFRKQADQALAEIDRLMVQSERLMASAKDLALLASKAENFSSAFGTAATGRVLVE